MYDKRLEAEKREYEERTYCGSKKEQVEKGGRRQKKRNIQFSSLSRSYILSTHLSTVVMDHSSDLQKHKTAYLICLMGKVNKSLLQVEADEKTYFLVNEA